MQKNRTELRTDQFREVLTKTNPVPDSSNLEPISFSWVPSWVKILAEVMTMAIKASKQNCQSLIEFEPWWMVEPAPNVFSFYVFVTSAKYQLFLISAFIFSFFRSQNFTQNSGKYRTNMLIIALRGYYSDCQIIPTRLIISCKVNKFKTSVSYANKNW